jgi:hypothetical protein
MNHFQSSIPIETSFRLLNPSSISIDVKTKPQINCGDDETLQKIICHVNKGASKTRPFHNEELILNNSLSPSGNNSAQELMAGPSTLALESTWKKPHTIFGWWCQTLPAPFRRWNQFGYFICINLSQLIVVRGQCKYKIAVSFLCVQSVKNNGQRWTWDCESEWIPNNSTE